jgi:hypothetical protein
MLRLRLRPSESETDSFDVVSGQASVGLIKKAPLGDNWLWSITGFYASPRELGPSWGAAESQEDALRAFADRWRSWLEWAGLREIDRTDDIEALEVDARKLLTPHH